jgi:hypothetical protein
LQLGWEKPRADVSPAGAFFIPTGDWERAAARTAAIGIVDRTV